MWREFEIKNFIGIQTARIQSKNACASISNLDFRDKSGDLVLRRGYTKLYDKPTLPVKLSNFTVIDFQNVFVTSSGVEQEVTILVAKARLSGYRTDYGYPAEQDIITIWASHSWDGSAWIEGWTWLNECIMINASGDASDDYLFTLDTNDSDVLAQDFTGWTAVNITTSGNIKSAKIGYSTQTSLNPTLARLELHVSNNNTGWDYGTASSSGDTFILMKNYIPYDNLLENYNGAVSFHKVLDELRIGFGSESNRLGLYVKFVDKDFCLAQTDPFDTSVYDPSGTDMNSAASINTLTNLSGLICGGYNADEIEADLDYADSGSPTGGEESLSQLWYRIAVVVVLDGYNKFFINTFQAEASIAYNPIDITVKLRYGLETKRITAVKLYWGARENAGADSNVNAYYFFKSYDMSSAGDDWIIDSDGYWKPDTHYTFDGRDEVKDLELEDDLGYTHTSETVKSWDKSIVSSGKAFVTNGYIDESYINKIFFSAIGGSGAFMYDVIPAENYYEAENYDGNSLRNISILPNMDLLLLKQNNVTMLDPISGRTRGITFGQGLTGINSLVNFGDKLGWASEYDIYETNGASTQIISKDTIREAYRDITNKDSLIGAIDQKENSYILSDDTDITYLLTNRGWTQYKFYLQPEIYRPSGDGGLMFLNSNKIFKLDNSYRDKDLSDNWQYIPIEWQSIDFDIDLLGESLPRTHKIYVSAIWIYYKYNGSNLKYGIYLDDVLFKEFDLPTATAYKKVKKRLPISAKCDKFYLKLSSTGALNTVSIASLGVLWKAIPTR